MSVAYNCVKLVTVTLFIREMELRSKISCFNINVKFHIHLKSGQVPIYKVRYYSVCVSSMNVKCLSMTFSVASVVETCPKYGHRSYKTQVAWETLSQIGKVLLETLTKKLCCIVLYLFAYILSIVHKYFSYNAR